MKPKPKFDSQAFYERLFRFGTDCRHLVIKLPKTEFNKIFTKQLIRSSSSPGANYVEALEALSKKDFVHRLRICRRETRESAHWLRNIKEANNKIDTITNKRNILINEAIEIKKILSSSILTIGKIRD